MRDACELQARKKRGNRSSSKVFMDASSSKKMTRFILF